MMNGPEKSDPAIVAMKPTNKAGQPAAERSAAEPNAAEPVERRAGTKGNADQQSTHRTQSRASASQALERIRKVATERKQERFTTLFHHIDTDLLEEAFYELAQNAAPGVDRMTWKDYEADIERNLEDLHGRVHRGAYRALPSRRVYIPKPDGRQRPLAVAALEDKIVVQPVFDTIAQSAARLCKAQFCHVFRFDGEFMHFAASHGLTSEGVEAIRTRGPSTPGRAGPAARSILTGTVEEIPDVHADPDYEHGHVAKIINYRSIVAVPMLKDGRPIGAIAMARSQIGRFPDWQIKLLKTFADQAVIAIENVRSFHEVQARSRELGESLEQQTATSEVHGVISSSPGELEPVFQTMLANAARLCDASHGAMWLCEGDAFRAVALH